MRKSGRWWLAVFALCGPPAGYGHEHSAPWLDEAGLDRGLYVELRHPRVIRNPRAFEFSVVVVNLAGEREVSVRGVRYSLPGEPGPISHPRRRDLPSRRDSYLRYKGVLSELRRAGERRDRSSAESLGREANALLLDISAGAFRDRQRVDAALIPEAGSVLEIVVAVDVLEGPSLRTIRRNAAIAVEPPLPAGADGSWLAGDQHLHTAYSIDAFFLQGTHENVTDYADTAQALGLDWIIVTDHSNLDFLVWYRPYLFAFGELMARTYRDRNDYLVLQGQEMGIGSPGKLGEPAHLLAYPRFADSTGYLANPCPGPPLGHRNCEPEQVVLDRVNASGGIGFIAHPFDETPFSYAPWDRESGASGWAGLEVFVSDRGRLGESNLQAIAWWHELLAEIPSPRGGELADRPGFPTRFPVGLGNSDAHQPVRIGAAFSYARMPGVGRGVGMVPREELMSALLEGRIVASNGPLAYGEIGGAGTGEVAVVPEGETSIVLTLETTPEFGPVSDYALEIFVNGALRRVVPSSGSGFERTVVANEAFSPGDRFVTIAAERTRCDGCAPDELRYVSLSNPIWLELLAR